MNAGSSRSKGKRSFPGLQFDARLGNVNIRIDECDDDVGLGCRRASWDGGRGSEGGGGEGGGGWEDVDAMSDTSQNENDIYLTKTETRRPGLVSI